MKKYKIHRYYGGDYPDDTVFADTLEEAVKLGSSAEHYEIIDIKTNILLT